MVAGRLNYHIEYNKIVNPPGRPIKITADMLRFLHSVRLALHHAQVFNPDIL